MSELYVFKKSIGGHLSKMKFLSRNEKVLRPATPEERKLALTDEEIVDEVIQRFYKKHGLNYELIVREGAGRGVGRIERQLTPEDLEEQ